MSEVVKTYQNIGAKCKFLANIDWIGNYKIHSISEKDIQYIGEARNIDQYLKRFIDLVKELVLKNVSDINTIRWNIKGFDESISLHFLIREVSKILEKFIKIEVTKKYPYLSDRIDKHTTNFNKTLIIEITKNNKIIFLANLSIEAFL